MILIPYQEYLELIEKSELNDESYKQISGLLAAVFLKNTQSIGPMGVISIGIRGFGDIADLIKSELGIEVEFYHDNRAGSLPTIKIKKEK